MTDPTPHLEEVRRVVATTAAWAAATPAVSSVLVVGSYAYGRPGPDSDVDLVVVTAEPSALATSDAWVRRIVGDRSVPVREQDWGPLRERRFRCASGLEVELGITPLDWLAVPVDAGTARVLRDGCAVVQDLDGRAARALAALDLPVRLWGRYDPWAARPAAD